MIAPDVLRRIPTEPGVYLLQDDEGTVLYIGKAASLRTRVRSYFRPDRNRGIRLRELARRATGVETIVVGSEGEALILEANLIKEHQPRFNVQLRDDKRYPYIKVTVQEPFPRVYVTRKVRQDGARYFGPFPSVGPMRQALDLIRRLYTVRSCRYDLPGEAPPRACLDYHIGRCRAPCVGLQSRESYRAMIDEILRILDGGTGELRQEVEASMARAVTELRFEEAARHRDVLRGLATISGEQRVEAVDGGNRDVLALARDGALASIVLLRFRRGVLLARESHRLEEVGEMEEPDILGGIASQVYLSRGTDARHDLPSEILLPFDFGDRATLAEILSERAGRRIQLVVPMRGEKRRLVDLASQNARHLLEERVQATEGTEAPADAVLYELQDRLDLKVVPRLIFCFDISHTQGSELVASVVGFENGEPRRALTRRMRIRGPWTNDDFRSMAEAVERTLRRRLEEAAPLPELLLVDGGKGQLSAVLPVLHALGTPEIAVAALAKRDEEIFLPGRAEPLRLPRRDPALRLLQRIRNEAHRVAIGYNRQLRGRRTLSSRLSEIPGVGPARQRALLTRFGSVRGVRGATEGEIADVPGFSATLARRVLDHLQEER